MIGREFRWPLDFEGAIAILNAVKHECYDDWYVWGEWAKTPKDDYKGFTEFEALAIAEKYLRDQVVSLRFSSSDNTHSETDATVSAILQMKALS